VTHYTSIRELARELNCGESLLRGLILAIRAPVEDRLLAHWGKISTNELVRRAKVAEIKSAAKEHEATEFERTQASIRGSKTICDWLIQEKWSGGFGEQIFCEAQRKLALAERTNQFPKDAAPAAMAVVEIIRRPRPHAGSQGGPFAHSPIQAFDIRRLNWPSMCSSKDKKGMRDPQRVALLLPLGLLDQ